MTRADILNLLQTAGKFDTLIPEYVFRKNGLDSKIAPILSFEFNGSVTVVCRINTLVNHKSNSDIVLCNRIPTTAIDYVTAVTLGELFDLFDRSHDEIIDSVKAL
jgi:hypothetical protein